MRFQRLSASLSTLAVLAISLSACTHQHRAARRVSDLLASELDLVLHERDDGSAHFVARVVDLRTGKDLYARDIDMPVMPASNGKLAVAAATLDQFGSAYTFP